MKIFTEEQVRKAYRDGNLDGFSHVSALEMCIDSLIPINLPSDEQIDNKSVESWCPSIFIGAAKWVIEQIKQQDNE